MPTYEYPRRQLEMVLHTFSPREVQARVRAGESPDVIAAESDWPLDKVMRYAEPLLAERSFIAEQAQTVEIRRSGGGATLAESAHASLGTDPESDVIAWDSYRREDGKWVVTAAYTDQDGRHLARWTYDHMGRNIHPLDDDARTLMGARPVAVPDAEVDIAEALDLVADVPVVREADVRPHLVAVPDSEDSDDSDDSEPADAVEAAAPETPPAATANQPTVTLPHPSLLDPEDEAAPEHPKAPEKATRKPKTKRGRASVPSWDEILFGATKHED